MHVHALGPGSSLRPTRAAPRTGGAPGAPASLPRAVFPTYRERTEAPAYRDPARPQPPDAEPRLRSSLTPPRLAHAAALPHRSSLHPLRPLRPGGSLLPASRRSVAAPRSHRRRQAHPACARVRVVAAVAVGAAALALAPAARGPRRPAHVAPVVEL